MTIIKERIKKKTFKNVIDIRSNSFYILFNTVINCDFYAQIRSCVLIAFRSSYDILMIVE